MMAYRIYAVDLNGCRTIKSELDGTSDSEALKAAFGVIRRFPAQRVWLLECDPDDASDGADTLLH